MQFQNPPAPPDGVVFAVIGREIQNLHGLADRIAEFHDALQELRAYAAAFRPVVRFQLDIVNALPFFRRQALPPAIERVHNEIARLVGAAQVDEQVAGVFIHYAARRMAPLGGKTVVAGFVVPTAQAAPGEPAKLDRRLAIHAQPDDTLIRVFGFLVLFLQFQISHPSP